MSLSNLIRGKREPAMLATATPATFATGRRTVASVASVAVATPPQRLSALPLKVGTGNAATTSYWWLIHFADRNPLEVACTPEVTQAVILEQYPDAIAAEPFEPTLQAPEAAMTTSEIEAIRSLLIQLDETDPAMIASIYKQCHQDANARAYLLKQSNNGNHDANL